MDSKVLDNSELYSYECGKKPYRTEPNLKSFLLVSELLEYSIMLIKLALNWEYSQQLFQPCILLMWFPTKYILSLGTLLFHCPDSRPSHCHVFIPLSLHFHTYFYLTQVHKVARIFKCFSEHITLLFKTLQWLLIIMHIKLKIPSTAFTLVPANLSYCPAHSLS